MAVYQWKSAVSGSWATASRWSPSGGPQVQPTDIPGLSLSSDTAEFATGSARSYSVSTGGLSAAMVVSGDHVNFVHFLNGDQGYGGSLSVTHGGVAIFDRASVLDYQAHDRLGGGSLSVDGSLVIDHGTMSVGDVSLTHHGLLAEVGPTATIQALYGTTISPGSTMAVLAGATYANSQPYSAIDGTLVVSGVGSSARLVLPAGSGAVLVKDQASVTAFGPTSGTLGFGVGHAAKLTFGGPLGHGNVVTFSGGAGTLALDQGPAGDIVGFDATDTLLVGGTVTKAVYTAGTGGHGSLALFDGGHLVETQAIRGDYSGDVFQVSAAGAAESRITVRGVSHPPTSAASGNASLGAGLGVAAEVQAAGAFSYGASIAGAPTAMPGSAEPTLRHASFELTHTLADGANIQFVGGLH